MQKSYDYTYVITSAKDINGQNIDTSGWITETLTGTKTIGAGSTEYATFAIRPPNDAPEGLIVISATVKSAGKVLANPTMRLNIRRVGWLQQTVC